MNTSVKATGISQGMASQKILEQSTRLSPAVSDGDSSSCLWQARIFLGCFFFIFVSLPALMMICCSSGSEVSGTARHPGPTRESKPKTEFIMPEEMVFKPDEGIEVHELRLVKELTRDENNEGEFDPRFVEFFDSRLYVYDDSCKNVVFFDENYNDCGNVLPDEFIGPDEQIFCMKLDEKGNLILSGKEYLYFHVNEYYKLRNIYNIREFAPYEGKIYSYNWVGISESSKYSIVVFDYDMIHVYSVGDNPFLDSNNNTIGHYINIAYSNNRVYMASNLLDIIYIYDFKYYNDRYFVLSSKALSKRQAYNNITRSKMKANDNSTFISTFADIEAYMNYIYLLTQNENTMFLLKADNYNNVTTLFEYSKINSCNLLKLSLNYNRDVLCLAVLGIFKTKCHILIMEVA